MRHVNNWKRISVALAGVAACGAAPSATGQFDGYWRTRGYGTIVQIDGDTLRQWDYTKLGCRADPKQKSLKSLYDAPTLSSGGRVLQAPSATHITLYTFDRLSELPPACRAPLPPSKDPVATFDAFAQEFAEHYAFFRERGVDWNSLVARYRPRVTATTTDAQLFDILKTLASATNDLHVSVDAPDNSFIPGMTSYMDDQWSAHAALPKPRPDLGKFIKQRGRAHLLAGLEPYLDRGRTKPIDDNVLTGSFRSGTVGYMQILGESDFADQPEGNYRLDREMRAAARSFDAAFEAVHGAAGLIMDLRINYGGQDQVSLHIAGRLTDRPGAGFSKCARAGAGFTAAQETKVPLSRPGFAGPVVMLISRHTISAGDELLMIAKDYPNVIVIGETSAGVYSDPTEKTLPNGWTVGISNERYFAPDGELYEGTGIQPDIRIGFNPELAGKGHRDPGIEKALEALDIWKARGRAALPKARSVSSELASCGR